MDRSDEVVIGTTGRVVKARTVHRMPAGQRGDAAYAKSIRGVPWQPNPAEEAEGKLLAVAQTRIVGVPMVAVEHRRAVPVMEPRSSESRQHENNHQWQQESNRPKGPDETMIQAPVASSAREASVGSTARGMSCGTVERRGVET